MILTRSFSRGLLLIATAACAGMVAQEMVSRLSSAEEQHAVLSPAALPAWQSPQSFYAGNSTAQRMFAQLPPEHPGTALASEETLVEPLADAEPTQERLRPTSIPAEASVVVVAQTPHTSLAEAWSEGDCSYAQTNVCSSSARETGACDPSSADTDTRESALADAVSAAQSFLTAMADPPPTGERETLLDDDGLQDGSDSLPPPAIRKTDLAVGDGDRPAFPEGRSVGPGPLNGFGTSADRNLAVTGANAVRGSDPRYLDPAQLVRERAIERGVQRERRLEVRRWLGYSPLRPPVQASPFTSGEFRPIVVLVPRTVVVVEESSASER